MDNRGTPVDINGALSIKFINGAQGNISVVGDAAGWYEDITIWCDNGSFYVRNDGTLPGPGNGRQDDHARISSELPAGTDVDTNFIHAIQGRRRSPPPPINGLRTIELTEAAWESAASGGTLTDVKRSA